MRHNILTLTVVMGIASALAAATFGGGVLLFVALGSAGADTGPGEERLVYVAVGLAALIVAPALGLTAAWHGWKGLQGRPSAPFRLASWGWFAPALIVALGVGQAAFSAGIDALGLLAHLLVATLAALLMLAVPVTVARRRGWTVGRRAGATSLAWGGLGGIGLAVMLELIGIAVLVVAAALALAALRPELLEQLGGGTAGALTPDAGAPAPLLGSPWVLAAGLLAIAVAAPVIEELCKGLAVPLVKLAGRPLARIDAFLLGAAAGAGFALMEGITNGALALAQPQSWASLMLVRGGVAAIHVLASGLAGLAWHAILCERRWARGVGLFAAAVATHGAWNGGAFLVVWFGWRNMGRDATLDVAYAMILALLICLFALSALAWTLAGAAADEQPGA